MIKYCYIFLLSLFVITGCKEVYDPDISSDQTAIVIQGLITNLPGQAIVKVSEAVPYDSVDTRIPVKGALVTISDDNGNIFELNDKGFGSYENPDLVGIPGKTYRLKVVAPNGDIYESELQSLPPFFKQDTIYAERVSHVVYIPTTSGNYIKSENKGIETYVNLSSDNNELPKCRYDVRNTVLYTYLLDSGLPPPTVYCWKTFNPNTDLNLTSSRFDRSVGVIAKHVVSFFGTNINLYDERNNLTVSGWITVITKYSMSTETHQYYLNIQNQLRASGKIFDPMPAQIIGNIKCTNNPGKLVFGFFEASYAEKLYYRYYDVPKGMMLVPKDGFPELTDQGEIVGVPPAFWSK